MPNALYIKRKEKGLCVSCGRENNSMYVSCDKCREMRKEYNRKTREVFKSMGLCPRCGKNKLFGEEKECPECVAKSYENIMKRRNKERFNAIHREWSRRIHHEMIDKGICTRCRKREATDGYKTCGICRDKIRKQKAKANWKEPRSERHKKGLCYFCDRPIKTGYKLCEFHYQRNVECARSTNAKRVRKELVTSGVLF